MHLLELSSLTILVSDVIALVDNSPLERFQAVVKEFRVLFSKERMDSAKVHRLSCIACAGTDEVVFGNSRQIPDRSVVELVDLNLQLSSRLRVVEPL